VAEEDEERRWIIDPPQAGEIKLHLSFGSDVELTSEQEAALSALMEALESSDSEVTAFDKCKESSCNTKSCKPVKCSTFTCHFLSVEELAGANQQWNLMGTFQIG
jgi:hypothetical protein